MAVVRAGTLDVMRTVEPRAHIWVSSKQPWVMLPDGVPSFPETALRDDFVRILLQ